jgi:hypothetical protein
MFAIKAMPAMDALIIRDQAMLAWYDMQVDKVEMPAWPRKIDARSSIHYASATWRTRLHEYVI